MHYLPNVILSRQNSFLQEKDYNSARLLHLDHFPDYIVHSEDCQHRDKFYKSGYDELQIPSCFKIYKMIRI